MAEQGIEHFQTRLYAVDHQLLDALEHRVRLVAELLRLKQLHGLPPHDQEQENEVVARLAEERRDVLAEESIRDFVALVLWLSREEAARALARREARRPHLDD
ncbi:MAG TPA: chorismate mutase [Dehalococcoidia bacterium]|jgi:chorismate mutase|nr:chorismate mutase [Dehalococcoidia bacterium]